MSIQIVFETHSWSEDNERDIATGWSPGRLSERGRSAARELGQRRQHDSIDAVFASDLRRAADTAEIAFDGSVVPILLDWRLRECDYGDLNGTTASELHRHRVDRIVVPYPNGESWQQAIDRVQRFLVDLPLRWDGCRIVVVGHVATRWALDHFISGTPLLRLIEDDFAWREGWEYELSKDTA